MEPEYDQALRDVPTGALLMKVMHRAIAGQRSGSRLAWLWCWMLEGLMVPLLQSLPTSVLDATDSPESLFGRMLVLDRISMEQKFSEAKNQVPNKIDFETLGGNDV